MIPLAFPAFVLQVLQEEGMVFGFLDFSLYQRGNRTWGQLKRDYVMPGEKLTDAIFSSASELEFIERESGSEHFRLPPRVQARFEMWPGDSYYICMEISVEELLTRFYRGQEWSLLPASGKVDIDTF